ncbi:hypothetical protein ABEF93_004395 [Exophiala dermatitidis]
MLFFLNDSRKRRKGEATIDPAASVRPPPYSSLNTSTALQQQPPCAHRLGPHLDAIPPAYNASTVSLHPSPDRQVYRSRQSWTKSQTRVDNVCPPLRTADEDLEEKIDDKLCDVISLIDEEAFCDSPEALDISLDELPNHDQVELNNLGQDAARSRTPQQKSRTGTRFGLPSQQARPQQPQQRQVDVFSKLDFYMNSRLPASLPPLRVYMPTYPLLCLAAQSSLDAYHSPRSAAERKDFVSADGRLGTKAMVIKSIPCDDKKTIVFAIRGTSMLSIRDWGVNLSTDPVSPSGFLDDEGNLCHSGFLKTAKAMVQPIAARLRHLLEEDPSRTSCSLLITGHSAGGAVAALLYAHMLAETVQSDLNILTGCFKRVHCITFGAPPVSLLPLQKPDSADGRLRKCLFHAFLNEGDPVARAEKPYVKSLVDLLASPVPALDSTSPPTKPANKKKPCKTKIGAAVSAPTLPLTSLLGASMSRLDLSLKTMPIKKPKSKANLKSATHKLWWEVPPATFSNAGRQVVLRVPKGGDESDVTASVVRDEQLRQVIFGDPIAHSMELYARRIEALAVRAVTGRNGTC